MTQLELIQTWAENTSSSLSLAHIACEYKMESNTYFVKLGSAILESEEFVDHAFNLIDSFESHFGEEISFLDENSLVEISSPFWEKSYPVTAIGSYDVQAVEDDLHSLRTIESGVESTSFKIVEGHANAEEGTVVSTLASLSFSFGSIAFSLEDTRETSSISYSESDFPIAA